jgi:hypothetical protein
MPNYFPYTYLIDIKQVTYFQGHDPDRQNADHVAPEAHKLLSNKKTLSR